MEIRMRTCNLFSYPSWCAFVEVVERKGTLIKDRMLFRFGISDECNVSAKPYAWPKVQIKWQLTFPGRKLGRTINYISDN